VKGIGLRVGGKVRNLVLDTLKFLLDIHQVGS
jgi:hypothetical protein